VIVQFSSARENLGLRGGTVFLSGIIKASDSGDWRPQDGVLMSPCFCSTDEELVTAIAAVKEILKNL
jgi:hypothetical protein